MKWFVVERAAFQRGGLVCSVYSEFLPARLRGNNAKRDGLVDLYRIDHKPQLADLPLAELQQRYRRGELR